MICVLTMIRHCVEDVSIPQILEQLGANFYLRFVLHIYIITSKLEALTAVPRIRKCPPIDSCLQGHNNEFSFAFLYRANLTISVSKQEKSADQSNVPNIEGPMMS